MESIVENGYLRHVGHELVDGLQACQVALVVHGSQVDEALDAILHLGSNDATLLEEVAALHHTVAHGPNLIEALDGAELRIEQALEHELHTLLVGRKVGHDLLLGAVGQLHLDESLVEANAFHTTLGENLLTVHVVELILDAAATAVQY